MQEVMALFTEDQQAELDLMQHNPRIYQDLARSIAPQVPSSCIHARTPQEVHA